MLLQNGDGAGVATSDDVTAGVTADVTTSAGIKCIIIIIYHYT